MTDLSTLAPPELTELRGCPVTWDPWTAGLLTSLRFHFDVSCHRCGAHAAGDQPHATGRVDHGRTVRNVVAIVNGREVVNGTREEGPVIELGATVCTVCHVVTVVSLVDPGWWWESAPDGALPIVVEHRDAEGVEHGATVRPTRSCRPAAPVPAPRKPPQSRPTRRRTPDPAPALLAGPGEPASPAQRQEVVAAASTAMGWARPSVSGARTVPCRTCGATIGASCTRPSRGKRVPSPPHPTRVGDAEKPQVDTAGGQVE